MGSADWVAISWRSRCSDVADAASSCNRPVIFPFFDPWSAVIDSLCRSWPGVSWQDGWRMNEMWMCGTPAACFACFLCSIQPCLHDSCSASTHLNDPVACSSRHAVTSHLHAKPEKAPHIFGIKLFVIEGVFCLFFIVISCYEGFSSCTSWWNSLQHEIMED